MCGEKIIASHLEEQNKPEKNSGNFKWNLMGKSYQWRLKKAIPFCFSCLKEEEEMAKELCFEML